MNSPSCTTPSSRPAARSRRRSAVAAGTGDSITGVAGFLLAASLLCACGGARPEPERPRHAADEASASPDPAKGQGVVTFRYSNRSTDANLQVDLGATDISLEMTGRPAEAAREAAAQPPRPAPVEAKRAGQPPADPEADAAMREEVARGGRKPGQRHPPKPPAGSKIGPEAAEEEPGGDEDPVPPDVTDKVLLGIRKAQEFFYQKRYPEALQMVRSSLEARPTAEGHALAGSVHYMMGATGLARRHWQQALRLNPDMPAVTNMLEKIATPGGRGSPHPRPLAARRNPAAPSPSVIEAAGPLSEPPFPDEVAEPVDPPRRSVPAPAAAPAPTAAPTPEAAPAPVAAPVPAAAPAPDAAPAAPVPEAAAPAGPAAPPPARTRFPQKTPAKPASGQAPAGAAGKDPSP